MNDIKKMKENEEKKKRKRKKKKNKERKVKEKENRLQTIKNTPRRHDGVCLKNINNFNHVSQSIEKRFMSLLRALRSAHLYYNG